MTDAAPLLAGVIGWPVAHSRSPDIYAYWAEEKGLDLDYVRIPCSPTFDAFAKVVTGLKSAGFKSLNITIPHKEHALKVATTRSAGAEKIGAANFLTFDGDHIHADNTDCAGIEGPLRNAFSAGGHVSKPPAKAIVLGAGGAARAAIYTLSTLLGIETVFVTNRTEEKATRLAEEFAIEVLPWAACAEAMTGAHIIFNATSLGMVGHPDHDFLADELTEIFRSNPIVFDSVYVPLETNLLAAARAQGCRTIDGLSMLIGQAVPCFEHWTGVRPDVEGGVRGVLEKSLKGKL